MTPAQDAREVVADGRGAGDVVTLPRFYRCSPV